MSDDKPKIDKPTADKTALWTAVIAAGSSVLVALLTLLDHLLSHAH